VARGTDSTGIASPRRVPPPLGLAPLVATALHLLAAVSGEVRATDELRILCGIELHAGVELRNDGLHSSKQQGDIAQKAHVASVCFKCFGRMLQGFRMDVAKEDRDVAYVAMVVHLCCKRLFPMFHFFLKHMLQVCLSGCCICFIHMLQVFYLDVAYVLQPFLSVSCVFL
jgi:hypothetical protein